MSIKKNKNILVQISILFLFSIWGTIIAAFIVGCNNTGLLVCLGLPISVFLWCVSCLILIFFRVNVGIISIMFCMLIFTSIIIYLNREKIKDIYVIDLAKSLSIWLCVISTMVYFGAGYTSYDSICKILLGLRLQQTGTLINVLGQTYSFGFIDPFVSAIGFEFGVDYFYAFYPMVAISIIGTMMISYSLLLPIKNKMLMALSILVLIVNVDFFVNSFTVWTHISMALYILLVGILVFCATKGVIRHAEYGIFACFFMIIIARTEGALYVMIFALLMVGVENKYFNAKKIVRGASIIVILWNVFLLALLGIDYSSNYYSATRGGLLILMSSMLLLANECMHTNIILFKWIRTNIMRIVSSGILAISLLLTFTFKRSVASDAFPIFLLHFTGRGISDSNNCGIWLFVLVLLALLICKGSKLSEYTVSMIVCYVLSLYFLCLIRTDGATRVGLSDSFRRLLMQVMPFAIWMPFTVLSDLTSGNKNEKM